MPTTAYFGERFEEFSKHVQTEIINTNSLPPDFHADIVIIDGTPPSDAKVEVGTIGVVSSDNTEALACFLRSGVRTVTCGLSHRDTVTVSSSVGSVVVCLQRRLPTFALGVLEPAEYTVEDALSKTDDVDLLLLVSAVRLLTTGEI